VLKGIALAKVPQELKESDMPWQVAFTDTTKHSQVGFEQRKQALGSILVHVVVYLAAADKYRRLTQRLSQEQKGLDERVLMVSQWPSHLW